MANENSKSELEQLLGQSMSGEDSRAEIERLRAENAALKKEAAFGMRLKVSEKGGVSVYGLGRFPVTLYKQQWLKLLSKSEDILEFIRQNDSLLSTKGKE